jgi:hypothetical protein
VPERRFERHDADGEDEDLVGAPPQEDFDPRKAKEARIRQSIGFSVIKILFFGTDYRHKRIHKTAHWHGPPALFWLRQGILKGEVSLYR